MIFEMTTILTFCFALTASFVSGLIAERSFQRLGFTKPNWRKENIPFASGIFSPAIITLGALAVLDKQNEAIALIILTGGFMLIGIIDDIYGDRSSGGFAGHFGKLIREGKITTGVVKAAGGGIISLIAAGLIADNDPVQLIIKAVMIALTANLANLMDVRPGRALKGLLLIWLIGLGMVGIGYVPLLALLAGVVIGLMFFDLRESSMLGDTGTGPLGASIGFAIAAGAPFWATVIITAILVLLHILSELTSFSDIIAANRVLKTIDDLGRKHNA